MKERVWTAVLFLSLKLPMFRALTYGGYKGHKEKKACFQLYEGVAA
jgi:hypothetical protein